MILKTLKLSLYRVFGSLCVRVIVCEWYWVCIVVCVICVSVIVCVNERLIVCVSMSLCMFHCMCHYMSVYVSSCECVSSYVWSCVIVYYCTPFPFVYFFVRVFVSNSLYGFVFLCVKILCSFLIITMYVIESDLISLILNFKISRKSIGWNFIIRGWMFKLVFYK